MAMDGGARTDWARQADDSATRASSEARRRLTFVQMLALMLCLGGAAAWALQAPAHAWLALHAFAFAFFAAGIAFRFATAALAQPIPARRVRGEDVPLYTLICPLRGEAGIAAALVAALERLDYPRTRLQIIFALEQDDPETQRALADLRLGPSYEIVFAPLDGPRTKPKALNAALAHARGAFCTIYDAEDRPHPQQLRAALAAFEDGGARRACVQAPLLADNAGASWIAGQFATEYAIQFLLILPFLARLGLPLPLGGTSNHFRTDALRAVGAWDSYNVTEDADLGYRLARRGFDVGVIDAPTFEEAPVTFAAWRTQRTRWIKGHVQSWFVLMRNPWRTAHELGLAAFLSMQLVLLGGVLASFAHLPVLLLMLAAPLTAIDLGPLDFTLAIVGYASSIYAALIAAGRIGAPRLALAGLTMPLYWPLGFFAAAGALWGFLTRPSHWAKTAHGVSARPLLGASDTPRRRTTQTPPRQARTPRARTAAPAPYWTARGSRAD